MSKFSEEDLFRSSLYTVPEDQQLMNISTDFESMCDSSNSHENSIRSNQMLTFETFNQNLKINKQRRSEMNLTLDWLEKNYVFQSGHCLPRSVMYNHYLDFCRRRKLSPISPASFGKIIKQKFPDLKTRRLGTRGQSKYHYYGISIKENSIYYRSLDFKNGLSRFSTGFCNNAINNSVSKSKRDPQQSLLPSTKLRTPLPDFPDISLLDVKPKSYKHKLETFMTMYRTHCQRIMDSVIRANFEEVNDLMVHFWQGMPEHMLEVLNFSVTLHIITVCDIMLYRVLVEVLIPASLQPLPETLLNDIQDFSNNITEWLFEVLADLPATLMVRKIELANMFAKTLRRQATLVQLAQTARTVLRNCMSVSSMLEDWRTIDFCDISTKLAYISESNASVDSDLVFLISSELEKLFIKQAPLQLYLEWIDNVVRRMIVIPAEDNTTLFRLLSKRFLLEWFYFGRIVEEEMTINSANSFGSFRLMYVMMSEYVFFLIEHLNNYKIEKGYEDVLREIYIAHNPNLGTNSKIPTKNIDAVIEPYLKLETICSNSRNLSHCYNNNQTFANTLKANNNNPILANTLSLHIPTEFTTSISDLSSSPSPVNSNMLSNAYNQSINLMQPSLNNPLSKAPGVMVNTYIPQNNAFTFPGNISSTVTNYPAYLPPVISQHNTINNNFTNSLTPQTTNEGPIIQTSNDYASTSVNNNYSLSSTYANSAMLSPVPPNINISNDKSKLTQYPNYSIPDFYNSSHYLKPQFPNAHLFPIMFPQQTRLPMITQNPEINDHYSFMPHSQLAYPFPAIIDPPIYSNNNNNNNNNNKDKDKD